MQDRPDPAELARARQARLVGIVLAVTIVLWLGAQWLGGELDWEPRFVFLFDLAAMAAFVWALIVTYQIWRGRQG
ncbi:DUF5337 domain-containing protein [Tabrizicola sp.]|uniref:DUF5337 domain-containing protein n=1 Tax=Tabrizicola sp. TaxID=2005166 RepID=UPI003F3D1784